MVTQVSITLDQVTLQTLKMGLSALQLQAQAADALLTAQVQAAVEATSAADPPPEVRARGNGHALEAGADP